ncbi:MAG: sulfite exporter TauE/SafE family protein [Sphingomonas sp.]|uniref:sulfite exporter TauE/SafE family protein n=1 Tax=Sphingomonas sp. TaxID=28214 RepID=UPI00182439E1|nr:sulfite exporter TauE/SafE family protein [Sphingomonas sp.]MBA3666718.1 sulfite exporter TauE/SafE family protein [Sphingomonas sp.]
MIGLAALFLLTATLYSTVGFGGGSTYSALLVLWGADYRVVPAISLVCNLFVVTLGSWRFARSGAVPWRRIWPLFTTSVPLAWVGGRLVVPQLAFVGLLALSLIAAGLAMLWRPPPDREAVERPAGWREPLIGGVLGFLAGVVGIGGGIFLAPLLHMMRWGRAKDIAGTCAVFILVNSVAGLAGQLAKPDGFDRLAALHDYWLLVPAVVVGGLFGSMIGSTKLTARHLSIATAVLVLYVGAQLAYRFAIMVWQ